MTKDSVTVLVEFFLGMTFACGSLFLVGEDIQEAWDRIRVMRRLAARKREFQSLQPWARCYQQAISSSFGDRIRPFHFSCFAAVLFLVVIAIGSSSMGSGRVILVAGMISALPFLLLMIRFSSKRARASFEGEVLISELLRQYRMSNYNIFETLECIVAGTAELKETRGFLYQLLVSIRATGDTSTMKKAVDLFGYAIDTNWSRMVAHNIYIAAAKGTNVSLALEDILLQLREARVLVEERKRMNNEAVRMTYFMVPLLYLMTAVLSIKYLGVSTADYLSNQFGTKEGLILFLLIIFLFFLNVGLLAIVMDRKFDY